MFFLIKMELNKNYHYKLLRNNSYFDFGIATGASLGMASLVFCINSEYGVEPASIAAAKQAATTFFFCGFTTKLCENFTLKPNKIVNKYLSIAIPAALSMAITYGVHNLRGTPEPLKSTIPTMIFAPIGYGLWRNRKIKELESILIE